MHSWCKDLGIVLLGSPDYFVFKNTVFGIDEARKLSDMAIRKAFGQKKIFFIVPEKMTLEAQNALLKTFEEPIADTHFFLSIRDEHTILPTLRSRMRIELVRHPVSHPEAEKFLKLNLKDRLVFTKKFADEEQNLSAFLDDLLTCIRKHDKTDLLEKVYQTRLVSDDRGVSPRMILEHLSLVL